jgi:hypothetical protein
LQVAQDGKVFHEIKGTPAKGWRLEIEYLTL